MIAWTCCSGFWKSVWGGGSICRFDGTRLRVGPESAGAVPGPRAYHRGGPLTVTDCNLFLGRIDPAVELYMFRRSWASV